MNAEKSRLMVQTAGEERMNANVYGQCTTRTVDGQDRTYSRIDTQCDEINAELRELAGTQDWIRRSVWRIADHVREIRYALRDMEVR